MSSDVPSHVQMLAGIREPGLMRAIRAVGGVSQLARKIGVTKQSVQGWMRCPRDRVIDVARAAGMSPEQVRPDLADWFEAERERSWLARARSRFAISTDTRAPPIVRPLERPDPQTFDLLDLGLVVAALRFAAEERGLTLRQVLSAPTGGGGGAPSLEQSARSYGMALAVVVGRVNSETVAGVVGVTRQAADNATERYLRLRDGDDPELIENGKVTERGRLRTAKEGDPLVWDAQRRFLKKLSGADA